MSVRREYWVEYGKQQRRLKEEKKLSHKVGNSLKKASSYLIDKGDQLYKGYDTLITETDKVLEERSEKVVEIVNQNLYKFEEIQKRLGIKVFKSLFSAKIDKQWTNFFVVDMSNPVGTLSEEETAKLLSGLHREGIPFKIVSRLRKTIGDIDKIASWMENEFFSHQKEWEQVENLKLDSNLWLEDFRKLIDLIANSNQSWRSWLIVPSEGMSERLNKKFHRLDQHSVYEFLFDLFQSMDENNIETMEFFQAMLSSIRAGNDPLDTILPSRISVEEDEIVTSDNVHMSSLDIVVPGIDKFGTGDDNLFFRQLDWLKQRLNICLSEYNRTDQIWISVSQLPVENRDGLLSNLGRHAKSFGLEKQKEGELNDELNNEEVHYLTWLNYARKELRKNPKNPAWQQSYNLLLKSSSLKELNELKDFVGIIFGRDNTWFKEAENKKFQWQGLKRMLPAIWKEDVMEKNNIPRNTLPIPNTQLENIFYEKKYVPSSMGAVVGMLYSGTPLVIGPMTHWGVIGTTSVGKSMFLKNVCAMMYPLDPKHTELFVADLVEADPDTDLIGWHTLLIELFGGVAIFPQKFSSPKEMRAALEGMKEKRVFLYMPNKDVKNIEEYDKTFLSFVVKRMSSGKDFIERRIVAIDELNRWLNKEDDPRVITIIQDIIDESAKYNTTCCYTVKTLQGVMKSLPKIWADLKAVTQNWLVFHTPDAESVPETIGFTSIDNETATSANSIVSAIKSIRPLGGLSPHEMTLGISVYVSGYVLEKAKIIVPEGLLPYLQRKSNARWGV